MVLCFRLDDAGGGSTTSDLLDIDAAAMTESITWP